MKNFKRYLTVAILLSILILPTFVFAAWWNPFTWNWSILNIFKKPIQTQTIIEKTNPVGNNSEKNNTNNNSNKEKIDKSVSNTPKTEKTINMDQLELYTSPSGLYSFQYPKELYAIESTSRFVSMYIFDAKKYSEYYKSGNWVEVQNGFAMGIFAYGPESYIVNNKKMTPLEFLNHAANDFGRNENKSSIIKEEKIIISGIEGGKMAIKSKDGKPGEMAAVYSGDVLYFFHANNQSNLVNLAFQKMLDTFELSEWNSWTYEKTGFTFDYPSTWSICDTGDYYKSYLKTNDFYIIFSSPDKCNQGIERFDGGIIIRIKNGAEPDILVRKADIYGKLDPVEVNGIKIIRHHSSNANFKIGSVAFEHDGLWYSVDINNASGSETIGDDTFQRIYKSFRFVKK